MITSWPTYYTDMHVLVTWFLIYSLVLGPRLQSWTFDLLVKLLASTAVHIFSSLLPHTNWHHSDPKEAQSNTVIKCLCEALLQVSQLHHILLQDQPISWKHNRPQGKEWWKLKLSSKLTCHLCCEQVCCHHPNTNSWGTSVLACLTCLAVPQVLLSPSQHKLLRNYSFLLYQPWAKKSPSSACILYTRHTWVTALNNCSADMSGVWLRLKVVTSLFTCDGSC
jgi:hypothetical protein